MNILTLDSPYSPFFSLIVRQLTNVNRFFAIFSKSGYRHYFNGDQCDYIGRILNKHKQFTQEDMDFVIQSNNHFSAYAKKFEHRALKPQELERFACFVNYFRVYLKEKHIDFVMMHNDLRWHHALAREICLQENIPFCVSELGLFRPYTMTLDFNGVNANSSIASMDIDFSEFAELQEIHFDVPTPFYGHESLKSKLHFAYFLLLNKLGDWRGLNSKISHNALKIIPYMKRFWQQNIKVRSAGVQGECKISTDKKYVFFPMQLENDTQFLIHSDFSSNQKLLQKVEGAFYQSDLAETHSLIVKLHPNDLGTYRADKNTIFSVGNTTDLVNNAQAIISVNSTVCMEALETDKPLFVLGRAFFAREDICQPVRLDELAEALSHPHVVDKQRRRGFINYLKYKYSVQGAGFSFNESELKRIAQDIERRVRENS